MLGVDVTVGENHIVIPLVYGSLSLGTQAVDRLLHSLHASGGIEEHRHSDGVEPLILEMTQYVEFAVRHDRRGHHHHVAQFRRGMQDILPDRPHILVSDMTSSSRIGSIGGLVTCANCWRK